MGLLHRLHSLRPRLARPKTFLGFLSLQMGTEIIAATLFFNKLTGAYGLLAILTGFSLSAIQLSAYLYNVSVLVLLAICIPHIRRETPLPHLALAWAYTIDTLINAAYTATFAISWYLASSSAAAALAAAANKTVPAAVAAVTPSSATDALASATATSLRVLRDNAEEAATAATAAQANPSPSPSPSAVPTAGSGGWMGAHETAVSLTLIVLVTVVRFYFCFVVIAHTRQAIQRYGDHVAESAAAADGALHDGDDGDGDGDGDNEAKNDNGGEGKSDERDAGNNDDDDNGMDDEEAGLQSGTRSAGRGRRHRRKRTRPMSYPPHRRTTTASTGPSSTNPFAQGSPAGQGWRGSLGRVLVGVGRNFWLGRLKDDEWTRDVNSRFRSSATAV